MAPAGEMAQLVTMMSGQNSLCRDTQQDYTKGGEKYHLIFGFISFFFFFQLKKGEENRQRKAKPKLRKEIKP